MASPTAAGGRTPTAPFQAVCSCRRCASLISGLFSMIAVRVAPGQTTVSFTGVRRSSMRSDSVNPRMANLLVEYVAMRE